jgi:hypothetical protein
MSWTFFTPIVVNFRDESSFDIYGKASATRPTIEGPGIVVDLNRGPPVALFSGRIIPGVAREVVLREHSTGNRIAKTMSDAAGLFSFKTHMLIENSDDLEILVNAGEDYVTTTFELFPIDAYPTP